MCECMCSCPTHPFIIKVFSAAGGVDTPMIAAGVNLTGRRV